MIKVVHLSLKEQWILKWHIKKKERKQFEEGTQEQQIISYQVTKMVWEKLKKKKNKTHTSLVSLHFGEKKHRVLEYFLKILQNASTVL